MLHTYYHMSSNDAFGNSYEVTNCTWNTSLKGLNIQNHCIGVVYFLTDDVNFRALRCISRQILSNTSDLSGIITVADAKHQRAVVIRFDRYTLSKPRDFRSRYTTRLACNVNTSV